MANGRYEALEAAIAKRLVDEGCAEAERGYGHATGARCASVIMPIIEHELDLLNEVLATETERAEKAEAVIDQMRALAENFMNNSGASDEGSPEEFIWAEAAQRLDAVLSSLSAGERWTREQIEHIKDEAQRLAQDLDGVWPSTGDGKSNE